MKNKDEYMLLNRALIRGAKYIGLTLPGEAQRALIAQERDIEATSQKLHQQRRESIRIVQEIFKH